MDAPTLTGGRVLHCDSGPAHQYGHDIPHPIGDPDEDEELPDDDDEEEDEDDDEEPLQG